ncbi:MAG: enolase C-terminal domain-like protein, partial [Actinomycetales bacterium]
TLDELLDVAHPFLIRLAVPFRGLSERVGVIFTGPQGWGEFAPFADYSAAAASRWLDCAVETAFGHWPPSRVASVGVNAIIPAVGVDRCLELVAAALGHGQTVFKVKVGLGAQDDLQRIHAIVEYLSAQAQLPTWALRLDANGTWPAQHAIGMLRELDQQHPGILDNVIEYLEQPTTDVDGLRMIREHTGVPIAVDELLRRAPDPFAIVDQVRSCADLIILKAAPLGGVRRCIELADAVDLPVVVSGSLDSSVGLGPALALAGALGVDRACGLGTSALLATDLCDPPALPISGRLPVARPEGSLERLATAGDELTRGQRAQLFQRVAQAWHAGTAQRWSQLVQPDWTVGLG